LTGFSFSDIIGYCTLNLNREKYFRRIEMNNPRREEPLYCPACRGDKANTRPRPQDLVCGECFRTYADIASIARARDGKNVSVFDWVAGQAKEILAELEKKLAAARTEIDDLEKEVIGRAAKELNNIPGGDDLPHEVKKKSFQMKKAEIWRTMGGNVRYARMKELEARIRHLKTILAEAEKRTAEQPETPETATPVTVRAKPKERQKEEPPKRRPRLEKVKGGRQGSRRTVLEMAD
jgi:hypothetical protein